MTQSRDDIERLNKMLVKTLGGSDFRTKPEAWISSGYEPLNHIMSGNYDGAFLQGQLYHMYGPSAVGKTILATQSMIETQKQGGIAIFIDFEKTYDHRLSEALGLNHKDASKYLYKKPRTWEEGNDIMVQIAEFVRDKDIIHEDAPIFCVLDSVASATPQSVFEKGSSFGKHNMNDTLALARVASTTLRGVNAMADEYNFTVLYLNQIRTDPTVMYGSSDKTPGGKAFEFYASGMVKLSCKNEVSKTEGIETQEITATVTKSKHTKKLRKTTWKLRFDDNGVAWFDTDTSLVEYAKREGFLEHSGAYIVFEGKKYYATQLGEKIRSEGRREEIVALLKSGVKVSEPE